jgi:NodT family efflux transporter outer membrane factor (OMF) lipoprotein
LNQNLAASAARLRQARELSNQARSLYFPNITLGTNAERSKTRFRGPGGGSNLESSFTVPVDFSYELDVWGKVRRQVESASASEAAAQETLNALKLSIAGEVAQTYWALRAVDADRAMLAKTLEIRRRAIGLLDARRKAGSISGLDLARAETEVATAEADRIRLDQDRVQLVNALAVLTGSAATGSSIPDRPDLPQPPSVPGTVPSELLRQRPDIRAAERRVAAANADIGVAAAAFYPSFTLNSRGGFDATEMADLFQASSLVWALGAGATVPITGQKYLRAQKAAAVAAHECGHAIQHQQAYKWLEFRSKMVPAVQFSSQILNYIMIAGLVGVGLMQSPTMLWIWVGLFAVTTLFSIVTLPVEFDASRRALVWLESSGLAASMEHQKAKNALFWAAMTYVAAAVGSVAQLLYFLMMALNRRE